MGLLKASSSTIVTVISSGDMVSNGFGAVETLTVKLSCSSAALLSTMVTTEQARRRPLVKYREVLTGI